jgi:hypothetical protein
MIRYSTYTIFWVNFSSEFNKIFDHVYGVLYRVYATKSYDVILINFLVTFLKMDRHIALSQHFH